MLEFILEILIEIIFVFFLPGNFCKRKLSIPLVIYNNKKSPDE